MRRTPLAVTAVATALLVPLALVQPTAGARTASAGNPEAASARSPELGTADNLAHRRSLFMGDRF